jgi:cation diffusion facilitator CzcD-associated flavoprotein CzcO
VLGERGAYAVTRWKNIVRAVAAYEVSRRRPDLARRFIRNEAVKQLPEGYPVDIHFRPSYDPWDQRLCFVPDGDLFRAISDGDASVVTDRIRTFTETGIELESGDPLEADLVVTATGLNLQAFGGAELVVDGEVVKPHETMAYRGMMLSGVPNFAFTIGYTNASWTLKADLVAAYVVRLLAHLRSTGARSVVPVRDDAVADIPLMNLQAGYIQRAAHRLPRQGATAPWNVRQNHLRNVLAFRRARFDDGVLSFE